MPRLRVPGSVKLWLESFSQTPRDQQPVAEIAEGVRQEDLIVPVKVIADWLPMTYADLGISGDAVCLRDAAQQEVRMKASDFVNRSGATLRFHCRKGSMSGNCIDFAGMGQDAKCQVACQDETTAVLICDRLEQHRAHANRSSSFG